MKTTSNTLAIPRKKQREILEQIPDYDPYATAGDCKIDYKAAWDAINFFPKYLKHVKGEMAGQPFVLEPWEQAIVGNLFGWKRADGKTRRYREAFVFVPRKNGKTCLVAGLVLYVLFCDKEPGAEIYSAAADREQATLVFEQAKGMVLQSPALASRAKIYVKAITWEKVNGSYKAISAEANTKHGYNTHLAIIDELHAQPNRDLVDVLMTSTGARRQPLIIHITTSDYDRESICNEKYDYASKVRDGIFEDRSFLPVIYEASRDDDWTDPNVWARANPNLDVSISQEYLDRECRRAQESPTYENVFKRLHLNIRTEQDVRWLQMPKWDACAGEVDPKVLEGQICYAGVDLSSTTDVTALVLAFPGEDGRYALLPFFWVPGENAHKRERADKVPYVTWARQGLVTLTDGNVVDYDRIRTTFGELNTKYNIKQIAIDRWCATHLITQLQGDGFDVVPFGQGYASMSAPTKEFEKLVLGGQLSHGGNPVLRAMASNVTVEQDAAGNLKPSKAKSTERIDGIVASIMALGVSMAAEVTCPSVYETRGVLTT